MATVDVWGNYNRGRMAREAQETAPIRQRGIEADVGSRELALNEARAEVDRNNQWHAGLERVSQGQGIDDGDRAQRILNGEDVPARQGISAPPLEQVARDPNMRDFLRDPRVLDQIAQLAIKTRRPDMAKWLNARYTAEKEGTYDAAEALSRGDTKGALDIFNARGSMKATEAIPEKEGDNRVWNVTLNDGRKIRFDTETERAMFLDPKGYMNHLTQSRSRREEEELKQKSPDKQAHARYYDAAADTQRATADTQRATADAIRSGERWRSQSQSTPTGPKQAEISAMHRQIDAWAREMKNDPAGGVDADRVFGMKNLAADMMRRGMSAEDALEAVKEAPLPSRSRSVAEAEKAYQARRGRFSSSIQDGDRTYTREEFVKQYADQHFRKQQSDLNAWRQQNGIGGNGGTGGGSSAAPSGARTAPPEAIDILRKNDTPENRKHFDTTFGPGAAEKALGAARSAPPVSDTEQQLLEQFRNAQPRGIEASTTEQAEFRSPIERQAERARAARSPQGIEAAREAEQTRRGNAAFDKASDDARVEMEQRIFDRDAKTLSPAELLQKYDSKRSVLRRDQLLQLQKIQRVPI